MASSRKPATVLVVDDHPLIRDGLAVRISAQPGLEVCGEAATAAEALALARSTNPRLMIVDLTLKSGDGLDLIRQVRAEGFRARILVLSAHEESLYGERALRAGAHGYLNKQEAQQRVIDALRALLRGEYYLSPDLTRRLVSGAMRVDGSSDVTRLTDRELQVFRLIGEGQGTRDIAKRLQLSVHTIESHREKIRGKLNLRNGTELTQRAVRWVVENGP